MSQKSNLFLSIGKPIKDEYGRIVGKVASFSLKPSGKFDAVFVELPNGKLLKYPIELLKFDGADIKYISKVKSKSTMFCNQIPLIWRKDKALQELVAKKKISQELYQEIHSNFEGILTQLKKDAEALSEDVAQNVARCDEEIKMFNYALVDLEIEHEIGKIGGEYYNSAFSMLNENLRLTKIEKNDMETLQNKISNVLLGENEKVAQSPAKKRSQPGKAAPELPEPPVVVYVKEMGKAGI